MYVSRIRLAPCIPSTLNGTSKAEKLPISRTWIVPISFFIKRNIIRILNYIINPLYLPIYEINSNKLLENIGKSIVKRFTFDELL